MEKFDYDQFKELVLLQIKKLNVKVQDYDDYVQEAYLYILNRKKKVDLSDKYIYGDIQNGILNYARKLGRNKHVLQLENFLIPYVKTNEKLIDVVNELCEYEYGYLIIYNKIYGYSVKELSDVFDLTENKIYYEINKIMDKLNWVYR